MAVGIAIFLTYMLKCLHPPAMATALLMVLSSTQFHDMGWQWTAWTVFVNAALLLLLALLINNAIPGRHYPANINAPGEPALGTELQDIEWALARMDSVIDVSTEDLTIIYAKAAEHAKSRRNSI